MATITRPMQAEAETDQQPIAIESSGLRAPIPWQPLGVSLLVAAGSLALFPMWQDAWHLWAQDPLRSIGAIFPVISLMLVFRQWRQTGFAMRGSFWGLGLILLSIFGARLFNAATLSITIHGERWGLLHPGIVLCCYGAGCVLLFGGVGLLRQTIMPLCLLLLLNPVPREFNSLVDLPLQQLGANTARAFSHLIGLRPTGDQLKMMFAPDFGMMIVPGCNGVRGAVTLGYLALIFGYTRRLSVRALAALTLGAFLMGYVLNLTRLCVLVIYYRVGLSVTSIQRYGVEIDYVIGCTIFLLATLGIGLSVRFYQIREGQDPDADAVAVPMQARGSGLALRSACFAGVILVFLIPQVRAIAAAGRSKPTAEKVIAAMPPQVGRYRLTRTWYEHDTGGRTKLVLGDYVDAGATDVTRAHVVFGLWTDGSNHFIANSKLYQGIRPEWSGSFSAADQHGLPMQFLGNFYDDGVNRNYDAETACSPSGCNENLVLDPKTGLTFSSPDVAELAVARQDRRLPILLRREWTSDAPAEAVMRQQFEADAREFAAHLQLQPLIQTAGN